MLRRNCLVNNMRVSVLMFSTVFLLQSNRLLLILDLLSTKLMLLNWLVVQPVSQLSVSASSLFSLARLFRQLLTRMKLLPVEQLSLVHLFLPSSEFASSQWLISPLTLSRFNGNQPQKMITLSLMFSPSTIRYLPLRLSPSTVDQTSTSRLSTPTQLHCLDV